MAEKKKDRLKLLKKAGKFTPPGLMISYNKALLKEGKKVSKKGKELVKKATDKVSSAAKKVGSTINKQGKKLNYGSEANQKIRSKQKVIKSDTATTQEKQVAKTQKSALIRKRDGVKIDDLQKLRRKQMQKRAEERTKAFKEKQKAFREKKRKNRR